MAGHPSDDRVHTFFEYGHIVPLSQSIGKIAHEALNVALAQKGRGFVDRYGSRSEPFKIKPELFEHWRGILEPPAIFFRKVDYHRDQLPLAGDGPVAQLGANPFIDQPLMGCVLIDQHQSIAILGNDVILKDLCPCDTEREVLLLRRRCFNCLVPGAGGIEFADLRGQAW